MKRTLIVIMSSLTVSWIALFIFFSSSRMECTPAFGEICIQEFWKKVGDFVLFYWAKEWQTLLSGIMAIITAILGVAYLQKQILQTERHERNRIKRRYLASRATMPLALSKLIDYARFSSFALRSLHRQCRGNAIRDEDNITLSEPPEIPDESVTMLRDMIETSDDDMGVRIAGIINRIQVQNSRILSIYEDLSNPNTNNRVVTSYNIEEYIIDSAKIYAESESLFEFARLESDILPNPIEWKDIKKALRLMGFYKEEFPDLYGIIERRSEGSRRP